MIIVVIATGGITPQKQSTNSHGWDGAIRTETCRSFFHWFVFIHLNIAVVFHFIHLKWSFQFVLYVYVLLCRIIYYANQSLIVSMSMQYEIIWPLVIDCIRYNDNCKHYVSIMVQMCLLHIKLRIHHALEWFTRKWWTDSYEQLWYQWINRSWLASHSHHGYVGNMLDMCTFCNNVFWNSL